MANKNDERILALKKQIEEKKEKLNKINKFTPVTNLSIEVDGVRHNLNVLDRDKLVMLAVKLNSYLMSAKVLNLSENFSISGYHVSDWISDITSKIDILSKKEESLELVKMEKKLSKMLSDEKQVELELDEIESFLK